MRKKFGSASGQSDQGVSVIAALDGAASSHGSIPMRMGEIKMRNRAVWFVVGAVLVSVLVLAGTAGVIAAKVGASGTPQRSVSQETAALGVTHVFIRDGAFSPSHIEVVLGTAVTWTNRDDIPHGVIIAPGVIATQDTWQSGPLYPGA